MAGEPRGPGKPPGWRRAARIVKRDPAHEADEEIHFHMEMRVKDYLAKGMGEQEARAAAKARLGDLDEARREVKQVAQHQSRVERRREWLGDLRQDLRYGLRVLRRAPTFTGMAVATLAIGIGATTAIFSLVHAVLLAPLPYPQPDQLVRVFETSPQGATRNPVSSANVLDWHEQATSFSALGGYSGQSFMTLTGEGDASRVVVQFVQPEVLRALGIPPLLGRPLVDDDTADGDVVVMSHGTWQTRYGGASDVLGRRIVLDDLPFTVVGVMPERVGFPSPDTDFWAPSRPENLDPTNRTSHNYLVLARLAPGSTVSSAQAEMDAVATRITEEHPAEMTGWGVNVVPLRDDMTRNVASLFWVLFGGVLVVLLIACANLANLLLARAVSRQQEIAVRGALGAGRRRILSQLLAEAGLLAFLGAAGAVLIAPLLLGVLRTSAPPGTPLLMGAAIDLRMLAFTGAAAVGCALAFGLAPAVRLSRTDLESTLRSGRDASPSGYSRLRSVLLVAQVGLTVVLLVGAGLFVRSFRALASTELGFSPKGLVVMDVDLPSGRYSDSPAQTSLYTQLLDRVEALPGVMSAAATTQPPGGDGFMTFSFGIDGRIATNPSGREDDEPLHAVTPGYFRVLGRTLTKGRPFDPADHADATPVVIINESLARKHWPQGDELGQRIAFRPGETPWREIVGVVEDARLTSPDVAPRPSIFIPFAQKSWEWLTWSTVVARTTSAADPAATGAQMRETLTGLDADLPPLSIGTVEAAFKRNTAARSFAMTLVGGFGVLALLLSVVGLYGLISYSVAQRHREIGVRIALGARTTDVVARVLRRSLLLTGVGAAGGLAVAAGASKAIETLLFGVSPVDATTYLVTVGLVVTVALLTAALPAVRAARTNVTDALRAN